jgi:hypothetical protein
MGRKLLILHNLRFRNANVIAFPRFKLSPSTERIGRSDQPEALEAVQELADAGGRDSELSRKVELVD